MSDAPPPTPSQEGENPLLSGAIAPGPIGIERAVALSEKNVSPSGEGAGGGKILLVRPDAIGDMVLMIPLLNTLKARFPNAEIYTLQQAYTAPLLKEHPAISGILVDRKKSGEAKGLRGFWDYAHWLRKQHFTAVIMPYLEPYYARLMWAAGIPIRIGDGQKILLRPWLTHPISLDYRNVMRHECVQMAKLAEGLAPNIDFISQMDLYLNDAERSDCEQHMQRLSITAPFIIIHPASGGGNRPWSIPKYAAFITTILEKTTFQVVLTGAGKAESAKVAEIMALVHRKNAFSRVISAVDQTSLRTLMALIEKASCVIGTDTGPTHIAAALKRPVLCISPTKFVKSLRWGPWETPRKIVSASEACDLVCRPYKCPLTTCLDTIDVHKAFEAFSSLVGAPPGGASEFGTDSRQSRESVIRKSPSDGLMQSSLHIGIILPHEGDTHYQAFYLFLKKEGFQVWRLTNPSPFQLLKAIWAHDLCVIHSQRPPAGRWLRQLAALQMYIPPVWTADTAETLPDLEALYTAVFTKGSKGR